MAARVQVCFLQLFHSQNKVPGVSRVSFGAVLGFVVRDDATEQYVIVQSMPK